MSPTHTNYHTECLRTATETLLTGGRRTLVWVHERKRAPYRTQSDGCRTKSNRLYGEHEISGDWSEMTCILNQKVDTMLDGTAVRNHKSPGNFSGYLAPPLRYLVLTAQSLTHNNHHPAHYARRRDSAYMQLPGVFLHCDTCARVDGVAIRDSDTLFT